MVVEYKIEITAKGVTLSQRVEGGGVTIIIPKIEDDEEELEQEQELQSNDLVSPPAPQEKDEKAGSEPDRTDTGGGFPCGTVVVLGPVVFRAGPDLGGGEADKTTPDA